MNWTPNESQKQFLEIPVSTHEALFSPPVGGGKTEAILMWPVYCRYTEDKNFRGLIFHPSVAYIKSTLEPRAQELYCKRYGAHQHLWTKFKFPSGAEIVIDSNPMAISLMEAQYIGIDGVQDVSHNQYLEIASRCRSTNGLPPVIRVSYDNTDWISTRFNGSA